MIATLTLGRTVAWNQIAMHHNIMGNKVAEKENKKPQEIYITNDIERDKKKRITEAIRKKLGACG